MEVLSDVDFDGSVVRKENRESILATGASADAANDRHIDFTAWTCIGVHDWVDLPELRPQKRGFRLWVSCPKENQIVYGHASLLFIYVMGMCD